MGLQLTRSEVHMRLQHRFPSARFFSARSAACPSLEDGAAEFGQEGVDHGSRTGGSHPRRDGSGRRGFDFFGGSGSGGVSYTGVPQFGRLGGHDFGGSSSAVAQIWNGHLALRKKAPLCLRERKNANEGEVRSAPFAFTRLDHPDTTERKPHRHSIDSMGALLTALASRVDKVLFFLSFLYCAAGGLLKRPRLYRHAAFKPSTTIKYSAQKVARVPDDRSSTVLPFRSVISTVVSRSSPPDR